MKLSGGPAFAAIGIMVGLVATAGIPTADARCHPIDHACFDEDPEDWPYSCVVDYYLDDVIGRVNCTGATNGGEGENGGGVLALLPAGAADEGLQGGCACPAMAPGTVSGPGAHGNVTISMNRREAFADKDIWVEFHVDPTVDGLTWLGNTSFNETFAAGDDAPRHLAIHYQINQTTNRTQFAIQFVTWDDRMSFDEGVMGIEIPPTTTSSPTTPASAEEGATASPGFDAWVLLLGVGILAALLVRGRRRT